MDPLNDHRDNLYLKARGNGCFRHCDLLWRNGGLYTGKQSCSQHPLYRHDYNRGQGPGRQMHWQVTMVGALPQVRAQTPPHPP